MNIAIDAPARPALRYPGGKWTNAPWILSHFPDHRHYIEPYGGGASVLIRKPRAYNEIYNDLDGEVVNLFRVLRNPAQGRELIRLVTLTPYSREEFESAYLADGDPVEQARRTLIRSFMGFGAYSSTGKNTGFRTGFKRTRSAASVDWMGYPKALGQLVDRLRGVTIENDEAADVMRRYDDPAALFYVDPPYVHDTRGTDALYRHEMTDQDHVAMADVIHSLCGMVVVSGYACDLYDDLFGGWRRVERESLADGARQRTEVLWISPNAIRQPSLFDGV